MEPGRLVHVLDARLADLRRMTHRRAQAPAFARFDPVRTETEFYDAIYGERSGTVENIAVVTPSPDETRPPGAAENAPRGGEDSDRPR